MYPLTFPTVQKVVLAVSSTLPKPNPNLTQNFKIQTQPKTEFENLTQPKKNRVYFWLFFKENFSNLSQIFKKISPKKIFFRINFFIKNFIQTFFATYRATWSTIEDIHDCRSQCSTLVSHTAQNRLATECRS